jgi:CheY-like chemotaxis protein
LSFKVLLIDDSRTMREVLKVYLMGGEYTFAEAESAELALVLLRTTEVDLIVADINMPGMNGIEFVHALRSDALPRVREVPVILVTGDKSEETVSRVRDAHPDAFLRKPLDAEKLLRTVELLLRVRTQ